MKKLVVRLTLPLVCLVLLLDAPSARAQSPQPTAPQAAAIFAILIGVPVAVGIGVYYAVRAPHHIEGCVSDEGGSLNLLDEKQRSYLLSGDTAALKPNQRVGLKGKPGNDKQKHRTFLVQKVAKDLGPCQAANPHP